MALSFHGAEQQVDTRVHQHPDGYRDDKKMMEKIKEEQKEIQEALIIYRETPTEQNLIALKTEIGDELFAIICLANKLGVPLDECFNLMMEKNKRRAHNGYKKEKK